MLDCLTFGTGIIKDGKRIDPREIFIKDQPVAGMEPLFWYRPVGDDGLHEGPVHHNSIGGTMLRNEKPGEREALVRQSDASARIAELEQAHAFVFQQYQDLGEEMCVLGKQLDTVTKERDHWKANHDNRVKAARMLIEREDLPVERVRTYKDYIALQARVADAEKAERRWRDVAEMMEIARDAFRAKAAELEIANAKLRAKACIAMT